MIHSTDITFQMLEDWRNVDLNSITKQTLYTMEDSHEEHRKLIIQRKAGYRVMSFWFLFCFFLKRKYLGRYLGGNILGDSHAWECSAYFKLKSARWGLSMLVGMSKCCSGKSMGLGCPTDLYSTPGSRAR